jgi:diguanylate cyclase (GGDEF)-like protein/PAS domain S-box-containing protein
MHTAVIDIDSLLATLQTDEAAILGRFDFLGFTAQDASLLATLHKALEASQDQVLDGFYSHLNAFPHLQPLIREAGLERLKRMQSAYFSSLSKGRYDREYVRNRITVGIVHQRIGLKPEWYLGAYNCYLALLMPVLWQITGRDFAQFSATLGALTKVIFFDIGIALDTYFAADKMLVAQSRKMIELTERIFESTSRDTGAAFLVALAAELSKALDVRHAMVNIFPDGDHARMTCVVFTDRGVPVADFTCPPEAVRWIAPGGVCVHASDVQADFPGLLPGRNIDAYAGMLLLGDDGQPSGMLVILDDKPFSNADMVKRLLSILAVRAGTEVARIDAERKLKENEARLQETFNQSGQGIAHLTLDGHITHVNDSLCKILQYRRAELLGRRLSDLYRAAGAGQKEDQLDQLPTDLPLFRKIERHYARSGGPPKWTQLTTSSVPGPDGRAAYLQVVVEDISERKSIEAMLNLKDRALASSSNGIIMTDASLASCPVIFANPAFTRITGYAQQEVLGRNCRFLQEDDTDQPELDDIRAALAEQRDVHVVLRNYRKDGTLFFNDLFISPVPDESGKLTHFIGILTDITEQKRDQEKLAFQITHDELTGLPNYSLLLQRLQQDMLAAQRSNTMVALLIVDIDQSKLINERIGHAAGDQLIKGFADRLRSCMRAGDTLSRHRGDEFAAILAGIEAQDQVSAICEKMSHAIAAPFIIDDQELHLACNIGVALYPRDGTDPALLSKFANMARYRAKELGRNSHQFYAHEMNELVLARVTLESALRSALPGEQLELQYQPLIDLQSGRVIAMEALLRWQHPELGMVAPACFMPVAEECGLINVIGAWAVQRACLDMRHWIDQGIDVPPVAINISARQFRDPHLIRIIESALSMMRLEPRMLALEITEGVLMSDAPSSEATLRALKRLGVALTIDDFGTGYSSLSYLTRFPFDRVKIDRSFVRDLATNDSAAAIANAIISMAHSVGIKVIAEGVETEVQCEFMRSNMCDEIQGHFFSRPLVRESIALLLRADRRLPPHLLRLHKPARTLLLVDDEPNIVASLKRLLRSDGYQILTANSASDGLELLEKHKVDIILSDQRMPGMTGVDFLRIAKELYPDTVRIVLSGYTELQSVTDAINEGAVFRFLTKPWDDQQLRTYIEEAFRYKELTDENQRLNLRIRTVNQELASSNRRLEEGLREKQQQIARDEARLDIVREALHQLPFAVIGVDDDGAIAFVNPAATSLFPLRAAVGADLAAILPDIDCAIAGAPEGEERMRQIEHQPFCIQWRRMGSNSTFRGKLITLTRGGRQGDGQQGEEQQGERRHGNQEKR